MINVRAHIPFSLELHPPNYTRRRELFVTLVGKFGASCHIDGTTSPDPVDGLADGRLCRALLYAAISDEIL